MIALPCIVKSESIEVTILGIAQDGGVPQTGCSCENCIAAHNNYNFKRNSVSCGVKGKDGTFHLIEAGRNIADQLNLWSKMMNYKKIQIPDTISITHTHLGHIEGLGQFGKEVMNLKEVPFFASKSSIQALRKRELLSPFECEIIESNIAFFPSIRCGFELEFIKVPHRDEYADTHAIIIRGSNNALLFLPDHDDWRDTLEMHNCKSIREWFSKLKIDYALIDGTFWDKNELRDRDMSKIPHPTISETLEMLGERTDDDIEIYFFHLNHTNPVLNTSSKETVRVIELGWQILTEGQTFTL